MQEIIVLVFLFIAIGILFKNFMPASFEITRNVMLKRFGIKTERTDPSSKLTDEIQLNTRHSNCPSCTRCKL
jgi:hypothetical protein